MNYATYIEEKSKQDNVVKIDDSTLSSNSEYGLQIRQVDVYDETFSDVFIRDKEAARKLAEQLLAYADSID